MEIKQVKDLAAQREIERLRAMHEDTLAYCDYICMEQGIEPMTFESANEEVVENVTE